MTKKQAIDRAFLIHVTKESREQVARLMSERPRTKA